MATTTESSENPPPQRPEHPMVPVPDALRTVLFETARILLTANDKAEKLPVTSQQLLMGRTLASDVIQREPGYPPYRASIMDGYAIHKSESSSAETNNTEWTHHVVNKVYAGDLLTSTISTQSSSSLPPALYVTTGAVVPDAFDCVVPVEHVGVSSDGIMITVVKIPDKDWIRPVGCDMAAGSVVLPAGHCLRAVDLGLLLQSGVQEIAVRKLVKVGVLSTGNELDDNELDTEDDSWTKRPLGRIPDVNRPILLNLLTSWGYCQVKDLGITRDTSTEQLAQRIQESNCQVVLTTGGISMGESDIVEQAVLDHLKGTLHFGRLHMKPGKPTTFFTLPDSRLVFCLPGNPVSAVVCTQLLVRPCLHLLFHGADASADNFGDSLDEQLRRTVDNAWVPSELQATLSHDIKLDPERPEYHRVNLELSSSGVYVATSTGVQRSSRLVSLRDAQGLMMLPQATNAKPKARVGETYTVLWLGKEDNCLWLPRLQVQTCRHLSKPGGKSFTVGVVLLQNGVSAANDQMLQDLSRRIPDALSGSKSGSVSTASAQLYNDPVDDTFYQFLSQMQVDFIVIVSSGPFVFHTKVANGLRSRLTKLADAIALQVRRGAASQDSRAAMYETVVGYLNESIVVFLSETGIEGGLGNVRGLIKHALQIARGTLH